jgi:sphinganine C4-monooxygenase
MIFWAFEYFHLFSQYRIYPSPEERKRNLASKSKVIKTVLAQQTIQVAFVLLGPSFDGPELYNTGGFGSVEYFQGLLSVSLPIAPFTVDLAALCLRMLFLLVRQLLAFFTFDGWAYFFHYVEHNNAWMYRMSLKSPSYKYLKRFSGSPSLTGDLGNIHYVHHQLYTPYSYGASYNHPVEGFFLDILGPFVAAKCVGLSNRESAVFFTIATIKAVDDHSGYRIPGDPIRIFEIVNGNGPIFHNVHHQPWGLKVSGLFSFNRAADRTSANWVSLQTNFALYFTIWDRLFGTDYKGSRLLKPKQEDTDTRKEK